jgi:HlyD family secretion protein
LILDKKALLDELKIDRSEVTGSSGTSVKWIITLLLLAGAGYGGWSLFLQPPLQALEVRTILAQSPNNVKSSNSVLDATGYVIARRMATVSSKITGKVMEVLIEEGMAVEEGQLLAVLDDSINRAQLALSESQVAAAEVGIEELDVQIRQAKLNLERSRDLAASKLASQADLDSDILSVEALNARRNKSLSDIEVAERTTAIQKQFLDDMQIRAPFAGIVIAKAAQPGEMISPIAAGGGFTATGICTIVDMDSLEIEVDVNEAYINRVYPGQQAIATLNAYPDYKMPVEVIAIIPAANRNQATVRVRVGFLERDTRVLPEMAVKVSFLEEVIANEIKSDMNGVLVPKLAISQVDDQDFVWVLRGEQINRRTIVLGDDFGQQVLVVSGLEIGERIVSSLSAELQAGLTDGASVSVLN